MRRRSRTEALVGLVVIASAASCGGAETRARDARPTAATSPPSTRGTARERSSPFARALAPDRWVAPLERDHPLVGRVWSPTRGAFVDADEVARDVGRARYVLLGEKHDDPDHQRLAVAWIETIAAADRRPSVVFEMLDADRQSAIEAAFARDPATRSDPDVLARAIGWTESGWPFARYRPVVAAALAASFDVRAGNYPRDRTRRLVREGEAALEAGERARLGLDRVLPDAQRAALEREMADSHCGMLPATMLGPMALAQRARDGEMAAAMVASGERGSLLVAGSGHVRRDRGVPWVLAAVHSVGARDARAIANVEVERGVHDPRSYARGFGAEVLPFDYVVFTAKANDDDPCAAMRSPAPAPAPAPP